MAAQANITRRAALSTLSAIPLVALPAAVIASPVPAVERMDLLQAYNEWLYFERLILMGDIYPGQDRLKASRWVPCNTLAAHFHFPLRKVGSETGSTWETIPSPETRALQVLSTVGLDLRPLHER
ncbi:hypothetical protein NKI61_20025 [Mesorhizobium sp. M0514]|uniref:hypothetical protein n=1 Tax=Mesorhizobium sp. M0514 TaxID=2956955 RepID=UPI00333D01DC